MSDPERGADLAEAMAQAGTAGPPVARDHPGGGGLERSLEAIERRAADITTVARSLRLHAPWRHMGDAVGRRDLEPDRHTDRRCTITASAIARASASVDSK